MKARRAPIVDELRRPCLGRTQHAAARDRAEERLRMQHAAWKITRVETRGIGGRGHRGIATRRTQQHLNSSTRPDEGPGRTCQHSILRICPASLPRGMHRMK